MFFVNQILFRFIKQLTTNATNFYRLHGEKLRIIILSPEITTFKKRKSKNLLENLTIHSMLHTYDNATKRVKRDPTVVLC